jgi:anti-sigma factor RsiW
MKARSCNEVLHKLVDYADGELPAEEAATVGEHVAGCSACRAQVESLRRSLALARVVWQDGEAELAGSGPQTIPGGNAPRSYRLKGRRVGLIAAVVALMIGGALLWFGARDTRPPPSPRTTDRTAAAVARQIARAGTAAQLLTAADLLAEQPGGVPLACERYRYIASKYPGSEAASRSIARLAALHQEEATP